MSLDVQKFQPVRRELLRPRKTLLYGRGEILSPEGDVLWAEDWQPNFLTDEGEQSLLNVFYREQANPSKYLALLNMASPVETTTMATMTEAKAPAADGYNRQQFTAPGDWAAPALNSGDYQTVGAEKTFGPISGTQMVATHAALVTALTGTAGLLLQVIALSATTTVPVGQSYRYTLTNKAQ